jgi:hypothetical protein
MPRITKIYTRSGDEGTTSLGSRTRVPKDSPRVSSYGTVDELNAAIGVAVALGLSPRLSELLPVIQNELFHLGSDLCFTEADKEQYDIPQIAEGMCWLWKQSSTNSQPSWGRWRTSFYRVDRPAPPNCMSPGRCAAARSGKRSPWRGKKVLGHSSFPTSTGSLMRFSSCPATKTICSKSRNPCGIPVSRADAAIKH